uniref:YaaA family protein n=1 Tax=Allorhizocola rhizosphaerae TaxID=1872709 RepID=UPI000E3CC1EE
LCRGEAETARHTLGLTAGQAGEVARNARLEQAPAAAAAKVYTGVLYAALDYATLPPAAQRYARASVVVFSALWGMVGLGDRIPAYRCPPGVRLPGLDAALGSWWRRRLTAMHSRQFAVDLRSGPYQGMWRPAHAATVRVLHDGKVVSHFNKATKGRLVRDLALAGVAVDGTAALAAALRELGYDVRADGDRLDITVDTLA